MAIIKAFITLKGATSESKTAPISDAARRLQEEYRFIGECTLSVIVITLAFLLFANSSAFNVRMEYLGKLKSTSGQQEPDSAAFKLSLECGASTSRVVTGTYNRRGLPEGWDAFIREIAGYIRFYESYEDILNPYIYRRGRRQGEQIICSVVFHEKGEKHPYLTEDEHLEVGDKVLVQAGPYKQELPGKIVSIDYYRKEDLPEEMGDIGEILKKIEE